MKKFFNVILLALFCTSCAQVQVGKTFEFTYEGQTLEYVVADGNEAKVSKQQSERISGDVKIPESVTFEGEKYRVTTIGGFAFDGCASLTSITIPNSVTKIGERAFCRCTGLTSVSIPNSVTMIRWDAFLGCSRLTILTIENATPPDVENFAFDEVGGNITIYVPAESVEKYKTAKGWSEYADKIKAVEK